VSARNNRPTGDDDLEAIINLRRLDATLKANVPGVAWKGETDPLIVHDGPHFLLSISRVRALESMLRRSEPVDDALRRELLGLIAFVLLQHEKKRPKARPVNKELQRKAGVVAVLREQHGATLKAAISAVAPDATSNERQNIESAYRRLKAMSARGATVRVLERHVQAALARLKSTR
jgi:hypothetical protein